MAKPGMLLRTYPDFFQNVHALVDQNRHINSSEIYNNLDYSRSFIKSMTYRYVSEGIFVKVQRKSENKRVIYKIPKAIIDSIQENPQWGISLS